MRIVCSVLICSLNLFPSELLSQSQIINDGSNEFNPVSRINLFNSFYMDWKEYMDDRFYNITRVSGSYLFTELKNYSTLYLPFVITDLNFKTTGGIGDLSINSYQLINLNQKLISIMRMEMILPSASKEEIGFGRFILSPAAGISLNTSFGFTGLIMKEYISFGGNKNRGEIRETSFQPIVRISLGDN